MSEQFGFGGRAGWRKRTPGWGEPCNRGPAVVTSENERRNYSTGIWQERQLAQRAGNGPRRGYGQQHRDACRTSRTEVFGRAAPLENDGQGARQPKQSPATINVRLCRAVPKKTAASQQNPLPRSVTSIHCMLPVHVTETPAVQEAENGKFSAVSAVSMSTLWPRSQAARVGNGRHGPECECRLDVPRLQVRDDRSWRQKAVVYPS